MGVGVPGGDAVSLAMYGGLGVHDEADGRFCECGCVVWWRRE